MSGIHTSASSDYLPYLDLPEIPRTIQDPTPSLDERTQTVSLRRFSPIFFCAGEHEAFFTTSSRSSAPITPISPLLLRKQASSQELPLPSVSIDRQSTSQELVDYTSESRQKIFFNKRKSIITNQDGEIISFDNLSPETIEGIIDTYFENDHEKYFRLSHESKISIIYDVIQLQNL
ncbi:MAG TPA: hypothetical protein P5048_04320, partial [Chlamydiales bacterium]|nr:hypothetical protein [Chlamydiales bacterium]